MKRHSFYTLIGSLMILILTTSCASFPKRVLTSPIDKTNLSHLNGTYSLKHNHASSTTDSTSMWNLSEAELSSNYTFFDELNNGVFVKSMKIDTSKQYKFTLKILNSKKMQSDYFENDSIIRSNRIRYKLKKDGFVYLRHRNFKIMGIPYLFGGFDKKRNRLNLTTDNNLHFETSEFMSGGLFLLKVVPLYKRKYQKIYIRIN